MTSSNERRNIIRAGSSPKTICFSNNQNERLFEYQNENVNKINKEIYSKKKRNQNKEKNLLTESKEEHNDFRKIKVFQHANTNRCFIPELNNETQMPKRKYTNIALDKKQYHPGNLNSLISRTESGRIITNCRKQSNPKVYRSTVLTEQNSPNKLEKQRSIIKKSEFNIYKTTTQIDGLPGGVKRGPANIHKEKFGPSFNSKIMNDYKSKISCLPGTHKKLEKSDHSHKKIFFQEKIKNLDTVGIFTNTKNYCSTYVVSQNETLCETSPCSTINNGFYKSNSHNYFNISSKKRFSGKLLNGESKMENCLIKNSKLKRPDYIRNAFESQIKIN